MKFSCDKTNLSVALQTVTKALSSKTTIPILDGIYLQTQGDRVKLICSDSSIAIQTYFSALVEEEGTTLVPGRLFYEVIRKCPEGEIIFEDKQGVKITSARSQTKLVTLDADQYPPLPTFESSMSITMNNKILKEMIRGCIFAIAEEANAIKPILTGVCCEFKESEVRFVALDGFRLALQRREMPAGTGQAIVPGRSLDEIGKILENEEEGCSLCLSDTYVQVTYNDTTIVVRVLDGEFFHYDNILPKDYKIRVKIKTGELLSAIDRASLMAREGKDNLLKFSIDKEQLVITSNSQMGDVYEEIDIWQEGGPLKIAFNAKYFIDALKNIGDPEIYLDFNTQTTPCTVKPTSGNQFLYLFSPVRTTDL